MDLHRRCVRSSQFGICYSPVSQEARATTSASNKNQTPREKEEKQAEKYNIAITDLLTTSGKQNFFGHQNK